MKEAKQKDMNDERNGSESWKSWLENRKNENRNLKLVLKKEVFYRSWPEDKRRSRRKRAKETPAQTKYRNMVMAEKCQKDRNKKTDESHALMQKWLESHDLGKEARRVTREEKEKTRNAVEDRQRQARSRKSLAKVLQTPVEETNKPVASRTKQIAPGRLEDIPDPDFH